MSALEIAEVVVPKMSKKELLQLEARTDYVPGPDSHDEIVAETVGLVSAIPKELAVLSFVDSLYSRSLHRRAVLGSYAVARHLRLHSFTPMKKANGQVSTKGACSLCGEYKEGCAESDYISSVNHSRHSVGGLNFTSLEDTYIYLRFFVQENERLTPEGGYDILRRILEIAQSMPRNSTLTDLVKELQTALKSTKDERRSLIETLGACGILQPREHPSFFDDFIPYYLRQERWTTKHNNDWDYPVQHWRGSDGVNGDAVRFWFPELDWKD